MVGPGKKAFNNARRGLTSDSNQSSQRQHSIDDGASTSSSENASNSAPPSVSSDHSSRLGGNFDGNQDPSSPRPPQTPGSARSTHSTSSETRNLATSRPALDESGMKNLDVGVGGWSIVRGVDALTSLPTRPIKPSALGQATRIGLNTFPVTAFPTKPIYQCDVFIGNGVEKRGLILKVWESKAVRDALGSNGRGFVFDGSKLAWSTNPIQREIRVLVDLDAEEGRNVRPGGKENKHRVAIRQTNVVRFDSLQAWLDGKASFDTPCLEAINCLDHIMREYPSKHLTKIKRNFFQKGEQRFDLGGGIEAFKGAYCSIRPVNGIPKNHLSVNIDVANGTFYKQQPLVLAAQQMTGARDVNDLIAQLKKGPNSPAASAMKRLRKCHVTASHRGAKSKAGTLDEYVIGNILYKSAKDHFFVKDGKKISVAQYFAAEYNIRLQHPDLPLIETAKKGGPALPMEVLTMKENQRYPYKMDERQTSNMIKFAVTPPPERWQSIQHGIRILDWKNDPVLKHFGIEISATRASVDGRVLTAPKVQFGAGEAKPGMSGRWDLKGKKFLVPNPAPLKSWAVCILPGRRGGKPDKPVIETFIREFIKVYTNHGGRVENKQPAMILGSSSDPGLSCTEAWNAAGNQSQMRPQILVFILPDKDSTTYGRIKRSAECRYGVVSQCMQYSHVQKCQGQYISNVLMKFNAKLGGTTARAIGPKSGGPTGLFHVPTMILGADVSHAAPGTQTASMAALTMSMDKLACRYACAVETNGFRVEMMMTENINSMLKPMMQKWITDVGGGHFPSRIIYLRDGVSEGQYSHVIHQEVRDMKQLLKTADPKLDIPFLVIVGSKRHHVRFFPESGKGDRNQNPFPGTLVETGVTHPTENDVYLCSHAAIKGTARPMHYHVIMNEPKMSNDEIWTLLYEHSYQYMRATTPVSQHPAIYYAHLASNRAIPHDPRWGDSSVPTSSNPTTESLGKSAVAHSSSGAPSTVDRLMPMPNGAAIQTSMWYI
ncbi:Hypothetical protein R9X50_00058100 [Acrodontium crateriforme]|uniref:Uncharacterized protein n=1 Tax=Acrodontium crateriforme TaxID=150365 RepID=A0AAQ3R246_9PEZI|nr:Hypothetical protein R9X50_00058100 [Acrodontium crateriforme]